MTNKDLERISHTVAYGLWYKRMVRFTGLTCFDLITLKLAFPQMYKKLEKIVKSN